MIHTNNFTSVTLTFHNLCSSHQVQLLGKALHFLVDWVLAAFAGGGSPFHQRPFLALASSLCLFPALVTKMGPQAHLQGVWVGQELCHPLVEQQHYSGD